MLSSGRQAGVVVVVGSVVVVVVGVAVVVGAVVLVVVVGATVDVVGGLVVVVVAGSGAHWSSELHSVAQQASCPVPLPEQKMGVPTSQQWPLASHSRVTPAIASKPQHSPSAPSQHSL